MHSAKFGSTSQGSHATLSFLWCCRFFDTGSAVANEVSHKSLILPDLPVSTEGVQRIEWKLAIVFE